MWSIMRTNQTNCIFVRLCISANLLIGIDNCCSNKGTWCKCCSRTINWDWNNSSWLKHSIFFIRFWVSNTFGCPSSIWIRLHRAIWLNPTRVLWLPLLSSLAQYGVHNWDAKLVTPRSPSPPVSYNMEFISIRISRSRSWSPRLSL